MTRVFGFALGAVVATAGAYLTGPGTGIEFWLFVLGAVGFAIAALGQYFGMKQQH